MGGEELAGAGVNTTSLKNECIGFGKWLKETVNRPTGSMDKTFGILLTVCFVCSGCRSTHHRSNVPSSATWVNGAFIDCTVDKTHDENRCTVYKGSTGEILADGLFGVGEPPTSVKQRELQYAGYQSDSLDEDILLKDSRLLSLREASERDPTNQLIENTLKQLSSTGHVQAINCGATDMSRPGADVSECAQAAFRTRKPFYIRYFAAGLIRYSSYGLAENAEGNVFEVAYERRGLAAVGLGKNERLLDDNHIRVTECVKPVTLGKTEEGVLGCVVPINENASAAAAQAKIIATTVCAIVANPAAFNNRVVRVRGHFSGNFEYSELSGDGCSGSIWFAYGNGAGPPSLVMSIAGGAQPGAADFEGKRILPVPVVLVQDANFRRFESLVKAGAHLDAQLQSRDADESEFHQVTATFVGRIDAVSPEIHAFHLKRKPTDNADYLGFGQMGLFDAQFVLQSVEGHARLERQVPNPEE